MKPWLLTDLEFDDDNTEHLARHGIRQEEAYQVFRNGPKWVRDKKLASGDWYMIGWTDEGRALTIVVAITDDEYIRPFTGWSPTRAEARHLPPRR